VKAKGKLNFLARFHKLLQTSASHYTLDGDASERLMLKYYEYLLRIRTLLKDTCGIDVVTNLERFPVDLDPSLREYHEKIAARIDAPRPHGSDSGARSRYYIHKTRPFFVGGRIYYEVTFARAVNKVSKFDRIIAFTNIDMTDKYAAILTLQRDSIEVLNQTMPITVIRDWEVSIRPCEFNNFALLLGMGIRTSVRSAEYRYLMNGLTVGSGSLLDLIDMPDELYAATRAAGTASTANPRIFPVLDEARRIVRSAAPGHTVIRYLVLRMYNQVIKAQYNWQQCDRLSGLNLSYGCIPFDEMPFCTSLPGHNPRYWDLVESLDATDRDHELLARRVRNNVERHGILTRPSPISRSSETSPNWFPSSTASSTTSTGSASSWRTWGTSSSEGTRATPSPLSKNSRSMPRPESTAMRRPSSAGWPRRHAASMTRSRKTRSPSCSVSRKSR
jgi:hypothetical protein